MPKRAKIGLVIAVALFAVIGWHVAQPHETVYQGKPVSEWVDELYNCHVAVSHRHDLDGFSQELAENAIRHLGTNALPTLIEMLGHKDSPTQLRIQRLVINQKFLPLDAAIPACFYYTDDDYRLSAATAFDVLGPTAKPALPALFAFLHDGDTNLEDYAASIIAVVDPEAAAKAGITNF